MDNKHKSEATSETKSASLSIFLHFLHTTIKWLLRVVVRLKKSRSVTRKEKTND